MKQKKCKRNGQQCLQWIQAHPGWWYLICTPDDPHMTATMMKLLIRSLTKSKLYDLIFVLLNVHRNQPFMKGFSQFMILEFGVSYWGKDSHQFIKKTISYLT